MNTKNKEKVCTVCNSTGINKANLQGMDKAEGNDRIQYQSIKYSHCKGLGKEPK